MVKKSIILLSALAMFTTAAKAQKVYPCGTDEYHRELIQKNPKIAQIQEMLDKALRGAMNKTTSNSAIFDAKMDSAYAKITQNKLIIPVVVHIIHDFGSQYIDDNEVYEMIKEMNDVYQAKNTADLATVIQPFKSYIGNMNLEFRLAQKDPSGNPTNGITRRFSYLTNGGDDQAKFDQWAPDRYLNIWIEDKIGRNITQGTILAYATLPAGAAGNPYSDGVIANYQWIRSGNTMQHEVGHYLNLYHTWNSSGGQAGASCGDDEVDDTPPTKGHFSTCPLTDSICANGYMRQYNYDSLGHPAIATVDYPDTTNVQNIMDYSSCTVMFTKQQVIRMRNTLSNSAANRDNLHTASNLAITGTADVGGKFVKTDLVPVPDFSVEMAAGNRTVYMCANGTSKFLFKNRSWRDTIQSVNWDFANGATPATSTDRTGTVQVAVTQPGWVTVQLKATGNHSGDSTISRQPVYAADPNYKMGVGYVQEFNTAVNTDVDKWPTFNYYNNAQKWSVTNATGFYDKTSIMYSGYDMRTFPTNLIGSPGGDRDDFFTPLYDFSGQSGDLSLNFNYAGAYRTTDPDLMKDTLEVAYSITCGETWVKLSQMVKGEISTIGSYGLPFQPTYDGEWSQKSININALAGKDKVLFRFRFKAGVDANNWAGTGNNFFIDRIQVNPFAAGVANLVNDNKTVAIAPNPTTGSSFVIIKGRANSTAQVQVTDITGKVVFRTQQTLDGQIGRIEIPASAIAVKGMYMVHVINDNQVQTEKLVAY